MIPYWAERLSERDPFSFQTVYRFPSDELAQYSSTHGHSRSVAVIGAGIAGLVAALELSERGFRVKVFEESDRIGGRIRTHRFSDGSHAELGAMRIPSSHECTLHYADRFSLARRIFVNYNSSAFYRLRNTTVRLEDWRQAAARYELRSTENRDPTRLLELQMSVAMARLSGAEKYSLFHSRTPGIVEDFDNRTLRQHLEAAGLSSEAIEFLGQATGLIQYERASFLETLVDYFGLLRVEQYELTEGMDALPRAVADAFEGEIALSSPVKAVGRSPEGVTVVTGTADKPVSEIFDYVVCTIPARRAAMIEWTPALRPRKLEALRHLYYASAAKSVVNVSERVWETNDGIFGGGSFSDEPFQQVWYPSDNARATVESLQRATFTGDDPEETATASAPTRWKAIDPEVSHHSAAFTASYTWEVNARSMAAMSEDDRTDYVIQAVSALHPGIERQVLDVRHIAWDSESSMGGAFAYYAPGEHSRYLEVIREPHPIVDPRIYFAGEHVSVTHAWIQGSIQSALEAVVEILRKRGG